MNITKLTITPIYTPSSNIIIKNPTPERASRLIIERLSSGRNYNIGVKTYKLKKEFNKLPDFLKSWVNPSSYVGKTSNNIK